MLSEILVNGGYSAILIYNDIRKEISGGKLETTNNEMELTAVLVGLEALKRPCAVEIYSDSAYVVNTFDKHWIESWIENGWKKSDKSLVKNREILEKIYNLSQIHDLSFNKVKGHANDELNNRCDELARAEIEKL